MNRSIRPLTWIFGVLLLLGSMGLASFVLQSRPVGASGTQKNSSEAVRGASRGLVCFGTVDVEGGLQPLWPTLFPQPMQISKVYPHHEGDFVKQGEPLVEFDATLAIQAVEEAKAGVDEANGKIAQAKQAIDNYELLVLQQQKALEAKQAELAAAQVGLEHLERLLMRQSGQTNDYEVRMTREKVHALEKAIEVEQLKLALAKASRPEAQLQQAEALLRSRTALLKKAEYALRECTLRAPSDGIILRSLVQPGMTVGPQSKQPLFWFQPKGELLVRAEVDQEFAHRVLPHQSAIIYDDTNSSISWKGTVTRIPESFLPKRTSIMMPDPFLVNEAKILEVLVRVEPLDKMPKLRIGQKVRVALGVE